MLAWFCDCMEPWSERRNMSKEAANAAMSTQCVFANGAGELWTYCDERRNMSKEAAQPQ